MAHTFCSLKYSYAFTAKRLIFWSFVPSWFRIDFMCVNLSSRFSQFQKPFPFLTTKKANNNKQTNNPVSPRCMELDSCFPFRQPRRKTTKNVKCDSKQSCQSQVYGELFALSDRSIMGVIYTYHHTCNYICALELL